MSGIEGPSRSNEHLPEAQHAVDDEALKERLIAAIHRGAETTGELDTEGARDVAL